MNMLKVLLVFSLLFSNAFSSTKFHMNTVLENYVKLLPYMYGRENNDKNVAKYIDEIEKAFSKIERQKLLQMGNFSPSREVISDTISTIKSTHQSNNHRFTKFRLKKVMVL